MKTVVYIDVYFLINFSVDFVCLYLCGRLCGREGKTWRMVIASVIGAIYSLAALLISSSFLTTITALAVCVLVYCIAYAPRTFPSSLYGSFLLFTVNALFGGVYSGVISLILYSDSESFRSVPFFIATLLLLIFARISASRTRTDKLKSVLKIGKKRVEFISMVDTGNVLREPISAVGVALLDEKTAKAVFAEDEIALLNGKRELSEDDYISGYRRLTINSASGVKRVACVKCDAFEVKKKSKTSPVRLYVTVISEIGIDGVDCLLPSMLNNELIYMGE